MKKFANFLDWLEKNRAEIDAIFFDIDGTLIIGGKASPGARELIKKISDPSFPYLLLTNDGNHSVEEKSLMAARAGLEVPSSHFVSCGMALSVYVSKNNCAGKRFFVMGELGNPCYAEKAGLKTEKNPDKIMDCAGVIVGEGSYDWQKAFFAVVNFFRKKPSAPLLVPNPDSYWPNGLNGEIGIGAGAKARFIRAILKEFGIKISPIYFGKPYRLIYQFALKTLHRLYPDHPPFRKKNIIMIGDSLRSDILGANSFGIRSALVPSGITSLARLRKSQGRFVPEFVFERLA